MSDVRTVYAKARAETAKLLGYGDDLDGLTAEQSTRLDIACALRIALDDQAAKLLRGESADVAKLLSASEALGRLLPPAVLASPPSPNCPDPRQIMWQTYLTMRQRGGISEHGTLVDGLRAKVSELEAELAALKTGAPAPGEPSATPSAPAAPSNVVPLSRPSATSAPAPAAPQYDYNKEQGWKDYIEPTGEIRSMPLGSGKDWGPVG
jgi:hypothetical protein